jgi:putative ABC transport system permease protein
MLKNYFKLAWRTLIKNRAYSFINIFGLAIGLCSCLIIYLITSYELSYDTFHPDKDRIYRLTGNFTDGEGKTSPVASVPDPVPLALRKEVTGLEHVVAFHSYDVNVMVNDKKLEPVKGNIIVAEPEYFDIFSYEWLAGNKETALNDPYTVVISQEKARKYFGDLSPQEVLGKRIVYQDSLSTVVTGVVRDWKKNTDLGFTDFVSFATYYTSRSSFMTNHLNAEEWNDFWSGSQAFVKLAPGTTPAAMHPQFAAFAKKHFNPQFKLVPALQPLSELHFNEQLRDNYSRQAHLPTLYVLMAIAGFILLLAIVNFINLATAQSVQRAKEIGVRKVLGSARHQLILQFLGEAFLLALSAVLLSLILAKPAMSAFSSFLPEGLQYNFLDARIIGFILAITVITTLLSGFYPAWVLSLHKPVDTLKGKAFQTGEHRSYLRKGLVVFQFTISLIFITGTLIISKQMEFIRTRDLGFTANAVINIDLPRERAGKSKKLFTEKLRQLPTVADLSIEYTTPMRDGHMSDKVKFNGKTIIETDVESHYADSRFIPLYGIKLVAGRNLQEGDSIKEIVINETYAKLLGFKNPSEAINQSLTYRQKIYSVSGVVADFHTETLHRAIGPSIIVFAPWANSIALKFAPNTNLKNGLAEIEKIYAQIYPEKKFDYKFFDESIAKLYEKETRTATLMNTATTIMIFISCIGLFGLATFTAKQRTKEIGIRKVLGASVSNIMMMLGNDFMKLVAIAFLIATPVAWYFMNSWLQDFVYRTELSWWMFVISGAIAALITIVTISFQAIKAAIANPVDSLRSE